MLDNAQAKAGAIATALGAGFLAYKIFFKKKPKYPTTHMCDGRFLEKVEDIIRETDIITCTVPKCGQTWLQSILFHLKHSGDKPYSKLLDNSPWLENTLNMFEGDGKESFTHEQRLALFDSVPTPRVFKMHTNFEDIPAYPNAKTKCKIITITRDMRDVPFSFFKHLSAMKNPPKVPFPISLVVGNFDLSSFQAFYKSAWKGMGTGQTFMKQVKSYWPHRHDDNFLWLRYEDLKKDLRGEIQKLVKFLEWEWCTDEVIDKVIPLVDISVLRKQEATIMNEGGPNPFAKGNFFREGKVGANRKQLTAEQEREIVEACRECWQDEECMEFIFGSQGL